MQHAYLIMAHNEIPILQLLLTKLDHSNNDIYLHLDSKCKCHTDKLQTICKHSTVTLIERRSVAWGNYSQIQCELELIKAALPKKYDYYHLITGSDLPIKSNEEIDSFFTHHTGISFISVDQNAIKTKNFYSRFDYWHFTISAQSKKKLLNTIYKITNTFLRKIGIILTLLTGKRSKKYKNITFYKGSSYFDITHPMAQYIVDQEKQIQKMYKFTKCCDEVFLHTIAYNSPCVNQIKDYNTRYIDWHKHGNSPEFLTAEHYEKILKSDKLFARKFSTTHSKELIAKLFGTEIEYTE